MAKKITGMRIELNLKKDPSGEIEVDASAHISRVVTEYPDLSVPSKGMPISLTTAQKTKVVAFSKAILQDVMAAESAEDGIPIPNPPPDPEPDPEPE